jgi:protein O-GlcNAc transferase
MSGNLDEALSKAQAAHLMGDRETAMKGYQAIIEQDDRCVEAWRLLGICCSESGLYERAIDATFRAIDLLKSNGSSAGSLPNSRDASNKANELLGLCYHGLGDVYGRLEQIDESDFSYQQALEYNSKIAFAWNNRGMVSLKKGLIEEAMHFFLKAMAVALDLEDTILDGDVLGSMLNAAQKSNFDHEKVFAIATIANNLGSSYLGQGDVERALMYFRFSADFDPADSGVLSNWLMASLYLPTLDNRTIRERHDEWRKRYCLPSDRPSYRNRKDPDRKLRVGYVSPDFRGHAVNSFFESFYDFHDPNAIEPILYAEVNIQDEVSKRLESSSFAWRRTWGMSDEAVVEQILADEIDILVDLAGHTAGNRLSVFTRLPAPVLATYLGYPGQTALRSEAYGIVDEVLEPRDDGQPDTDHLVYVSPCFCCYKPTYETPPVEELPASRVGYITFGMLHGLCKLNSDVLETWCDVLKAIPDSKLFMFRNSLSGNALARIRNEFIQRGIAEARIELQSEFDTKRSHLHHYDRIDITLDTFPWSGHTTCTEALWMGVPAITMYGQRHASRMVASVLTTIGCQDWIARTREEYVTKAIALAGDLDKLAKYRRTLRQRMLDSPLCDGRGFAKKLDDLYRRLWIDWLAKNEN